MYLSLIYIYFKHHTSILISFCTIVDILIVNNP